MCVPCTLGTPTLTPTEAAEYLKQLHSDWTLIDDVRIKRSFKFKNFKLALDFVNKVGELAESEGHHPNIQFGWGYATIDLMTHKIQGLSTNDFILASKIDQIEL
jgi:4a-hydroxytetrahydrobiopterin dehydratase